MQDNNVKPNDVSWKQWRLQQGETIETSESGNSMVPLIHHQQKHILEPYTLEQCKVGDIVYCKVGRSYYTHLVKAVDPKKGAQISNNKGRINGWTKQVFGLVTKTL